jgi:hypothetical protein
MRVVALVQQLRDHDIFMAEVKERLLQAQSLMKVAHEKYHHVEFEVGAWVWLRLNHRAAASVHLDDQSKLSPKHFGLYEVIEQIGKVSYKLKLPPQARIHNVFHVVSLRNFEGVPPTMTLSLPAIVRSRAVAEPEQVVHAQPTTSSWDILVQWQGWSAVEATWEPRAMFKEALQHSSSRMSSMDKFYQCRKVPQARWPRSG